MSDHRSKKRLQRLTRTAEALLKQPNRLREKLVNARKKLGQTDSGQLQGIKSQLTELIEFSQDMLRGNYQTIDVKTPVMVVAAILYFLLPIDSIPDFILGLGYLDDVTVITFVFRQLSNELEKYRAWRADAQPEIDNETTP
ncbi:MAG: DUF1232 domain-containing protein [Gammaproteobacteria bacterium]|jgi:uncharacterized membrane protein YkvA (DUF1232 family)|nr:DUF1232 domain-containing protein [Gammaproteobacteria bacterium]MBT5052139.1 DUF1232 domain-containing protein [Gammaproteobacteria bacterium]